MSRFVVNEHGNKEAILLSIDEYSKLIAYLEDLEDSLELKRAIEEDAEFTEYEEFVTTMKNQGKL